MRFLKTLWKLLPLLSFTAVLLIIRMAKTHSIQFAFIPWNMFLAVVPQAVSHYLLMVKQKAVAWSVFLLWLLFFPNAMYIVTDLFHLKDSVAVPKWLDLIILFSAALNGIILGMASLYNAEIFLRRNIPSKFVMPVVFTLFLLCGYGIYLGRYQRWNSWDIIADPFQLLMNIRHDVRHPIQSLQWWLLTGIFATWLHMLYCYFKKTATHLGSWFL